MKRFSSRLLMTSALVAAAWSGMSAAAFAQQTLTLDELVILATMSREKAIEALAGVSVADRQRLEKLLAARLDEIVAGLPGVVTSISTDDPAIGFNIRGLQDYGRVAVTVDGARQNFEVAQHGPAGKLYLDPELLSSIQVVRGPVGNINGSGAIGGVVALSTKDVEDILEADERYGAVLDGIAGTNGGPFLGSIFAAARPTSNIDLVAGFSARHTDDYRDGNGNVVVDSGSDTLSALAKATFRPSGGQQIKIGGIYQKVDFISGISPDYGPDFVSNYSNTVKTGTLTGAYTFDSPDNPLIDFSATAFWNHGDARTTTIKTDNGYGPGTGMFSKGLGAWSGYNLDTVGFDLHNAAEFDSASLHHTLTLGGDLFADTVESTGSSPDPDSTYKLTVSGKRQAYGAFAQWLAEYGTVLDVIGAVRYDGYHAESASTEGSGQRLSPKLTVGITPFDGLTVYGTYAEGYRAPSVNEAFVSGYHPGYFFEFLPNPSLRPETGHTLEAGVNVERNGLFAEGDRLTLKANVFRNDVTDYIGLEGSGTCGMMGCEYYQYVNFASVLIRGAEVEGSYDAGKWFLQASATMMNSLDRDTGDPLETVLPFQSYASIGFRFLDDKLTVAPNWRYFSDGPGGYAGYNLFGLAVGYEPNKNTVYSLALDNIFNRQYTQFLANNPSAGFTAKASLKVKFAAK
jgi:hemoglobin/transferrin/lactoferrin receptor protein